MKNVICSILIGALMGCSSSMKKMILDSSSPNRPDWINSNNISWEKNNKYFFKGDYTIRGDERVNACIDLAKINVKETLITEMQEDLRGALASASESIKRSAEILLTKSQTSQYQGSISGLRFESKYWEKYSISNNEEKISCYVIAYLSKKDYVKIKQKIVNKMIGISPSLKKAVMDRQVDFFNEI